MVNMVIYYGRFIEIKSNVKRKKPHKTNEGSGFLEGGFSNGDNVRAPISDWLSDCAVSDWV